MWVLFDGECVFCQGRVRWLTQRDTAQRLRYASLQSPLAAELLVGTRWADAVRAGTPASMIVIEPASTPDGSPMISDRSLAVQRVAAQLPGWRWAATLIQLLPRSLMDVLYNRVAQRRHQIGRWLGDGQACVLPSRERS
jgi:predicted DCC family thiol-disulfide oxidoreductase YuxK